MTKLPDGWRKVDSDRDPRWYEHSSGAVVRRMKRNAWSLLILPRNGWVAWRANASEVDFVGVYDTMHEAMQEATR